MRRPGRFDWFEIDLIVRIFVQNKKSHPWWSRGYCAATFEEKIPLPSVAFASSPPRLIAHPGDLGIVQRAGAFLRRQLIEPSAREIEQEKRAALGVAIAEPQRDAIMDDLDPFPPLPAPFGFATWKGA
jgi:hypothetical protein